MLVGKCWRCGAEYQVDPCLAEPQSIKGPLTNECFICRSACTLTEVEAKAPETVPLPPKKPFKRGQ